jgi:hypothetical protein
MLFGVSIGRFEILPDLHPKLFGAQARDLLGQRLLGDLRCVDAEALGLRQQVRVDRETHGLL